MFSSSGFFRGVTCPYFASGLCERPHCHFRHVKPSVDSQKAKCSMQEPMLSQSASLPSEAPGHRGLPVTISRPNVSRKPSLLNMVGDAIKQVQIDIDKDKAHLGYGPVPTLPVTKLSTQNVTYRPTPISKAGEISRHTLPPMPKYKPTSKTGVPQYNPTPLTVLKKKSVHPGKKHKHSAKERETDLEYDPKSNYSTRPDPDWVTQHAVTLGKSESTGNSKRHRSEEQSQASSKKQKTDAVAPEVKDEVEAVFSDNDEECSQPPALATNTEPHKPSSTSKSAAAEERISPDKDAPDKQETPNTLSDLVKDNKDMTSKEITTSPIDSIIEVTPAKPVKIEMLANDDVVVISSGEELSEPSNKSQSKGENQTGDINCKIKEEKHSKDQGKDSEKENKSTGHSRHKSSKSDKDRDRSHSKDAQRNSSHHKHSSSKDKHDSKHKHSHSSSSKSGSHSSSTSRRHSSDSKTSAKHRSSSNGHHSSRSNHVTSHKHSKSKDRPLSLKPHSHSKTHKESSHTTKLATEPSGQKPEFKRNISHVDLFGDESDEDGCRPVKTPAAKSASSTTVKEEEVDSDDVISIASTTFEEEEFLKEAKQSLGDEVDLLSEVDSSQKLVENDDAFDECLDYFTDEEELPPLVSSKKEKAGEISDDEGTLLSSSKKRMAHNPDHQSLIKTPEVSRAKPRPSPAQVMQSRFGLVQTAMRQRYEQVQKNRAQEAPSPPSSDDGNKSPMALLNHFHKKELASKMTRTAHTASGQGLKKLGAGLLKKKSGSLVIPSTSNGTTLCSSASGKRSAHVPKPTSLRRPIVEADNSGKVPTNIRQRYLNLFIDDCLKIYPTDEDAFQRAIAEEKAVYIRSISKKIYLNFAINTVRKLRTEGAQDEPKEETPKNPRSFSHEAVLGGAKAASTSFTLKRCGTPPQRGGKMTEGDLYKCLTTYVLTSDQRAENGFPVPDPLILGSVILKKPDYVKPEPKDPLQKVCRRCGVVFFISSKGKYVKQEECVFHWGKSWKRRIAGSLENRYTCCSGDMGTKGCQISQYHVHEGNKFNDLSGYIKTKPKDPGPDGSYGIYALDCEMVYTMAGQQLARVTVIDHKKETVLDHLVKPDQPVIDCNTRFSGIKAGDLERVSTTLRDVQAMLLNLFSDKTILIGHSLESDFIAMKLIHKTVVDTSVVYPHRMGPPYKRALKTITAEYLQRIIQDDVGGHDSSEDAISAMDLMLFKVKQDEKKKYRRS